MSKTITALLGICLALLLAGTAAVAGPAPAKGEARPAATAIARPITPAPSLELSTFGFARTRAPRGPAREVATIARPTCAPRLEADFCEDGRCSTGVCSTGTCSTGLYADGRRSTTTETVEKVVVRRRKPAFRKVSTTSRPRTTRTVRTIRNTNVVRVSVRRPRVVTTCSPCATTCSTACDPCVDVCSDPCCDPCAPSCGVSDRMCTPSVFWSSGYHDGRSACDPCDPCRTTICEPGCAPRRVRVVRCATPCAPCGPRRCAPACGPRIRVGFGFPCGGIGWRGGWGGCGPRWGGWGGGRGCW